jgi:hypothetical protein
MSQVNVEEIKEKLMQKLSIRDEKTLLSFAMWCGLLPLDESLPERLTGDYIERLRKEAEDRGETVETLTRRGLLELAKLYGIIE